MGTSEQAANTALEKLGLWEQPKEPAKKEKKTNLVPKPKNRKRKRAVKTLTPGRKRRRIGNGIILE